MSSRAQATRLDVKGFLIPGIAAVAAVVVMARVSELRDSGRLLRQADPLWLIAACAAQLGHYASQAWLFAVCYSLAGHPVSTPKMLRPIFAFTAINRLFPSAGASGSSYVVASTARAGIPAASGVMAVAMSYAFDYVTFLSFIAGTLMYLFVHHQLHRTEAGAFIVLVFLVTGTLAVMWAVVRARHLVERPLVYLIGRWNAVRGSHYDALALASGWADKIVRSWRTVASRRATAWRTLPPAYLMHALDIATVYCIFRAFGLHAHVGVVTIGYSMAWLLSLASMVPSGLGVFEVSMAVIYRGYGIPMSAAVLVTGMYRLVSFWLPIPLGLAALRAGGKEGTRR